MHKIKIKIVQTRTPDVFVFFLYSGDFFFVCLFVFLNDIDNGGNLVAHLLPACFDPATTLLGTLAPASREPFARRPNDGQPANHHDGEKQDAENPNAALATVAASATAATIKAVDEIEIGSCAASATTTTRATTTGDAAHDDDAGDEKEQEMSPKPVRQKVVLGRDGVGQCVRTRVAQAEHKGRETRAALHQRHQHNHVPHQTQREEKRATVLLPICLGVRFELVLEAADLARVKGCVVLVVHSPLVQALAVREPTRARLDDLSISLEAKLAFLRGSDRHQHVLPWRRSLVDHFSREIFCVFFASF